MALALCLIVTPVEARCFTRWYYPWPQRGCSVVKTGHFSHLVASSASSASRERITPKAEQKDDSILLPVMDTPYWGDPGPDRMKGIAKLREYWNAN